MLHDNLIEEDLWSTHGSSNEDADVHKEIKYIDFNVEKDMRNPHFRAGMRLTSSIKFEIVVQNYSIVSGRPVWYYINEELRVRVKCKDPCNWECYACQKKTLRLNDQVIKILRLCCASKLQSCLEK